MTAQNQEIDTSQTFALVAGTNDIITKIGENYAEVTGVAVVTVSAPAAASCTLNIEQSGDGQPGTFDQVDSFTVTDGGPSVSFAIRVLTRFVRFSVVVPVATTMTLRLTGLFKTT